jgi:hypothetical protein
MQDINVFVKNNEYFALTDSTKGELMNPPMYNTQITLYKGIDNRVQFSVKDNDRKAYRLRDRELYLTIINPLQHKKIVKKLWCQNAYKGIYELKITEKELRDFESASYQASVVSKDLEGEEYMLYSSVNYDPVFTIRIAEGFRDTFKPSIELDPSTFLHEYYSSKVDGERYDYYVSSRVKADDSDIHTASIVASNDFLGTVSLEGSMESNPQDSQSDWFNIETIEFNDVVDGETQTVGINHQANCLWIRFKYTVKASARSGKVLEIVYRN